DAEPINGIVTSPDLYRVERKRNTPGLEQRKFFRVTVFHVYLFKNERQSWEIIPPIHINFTYVDRGIQTLICLLDKLANEPILIQIHGSQCPSQQQHDGQQHEKGNLAKNFQEFKKWICKNKAQESKQNMK
ncbi:MAG TPA: hypothetical protein DCF33_00665, partial [Saprospirales bacterium]|nr:hypothetical protein [Saprospirales bacterium]